MEVELTDEGHLNIFRGIVGEMIDTGENHASNIDKLPDEYKSDAMKINTLLSIATMTFYKAMEREDISYAKDVSSVWLSEQVQMLVSIAFNDQIVSAHEQMDASVAKIEALANGEETDDPSSGSGN